MTSTALFVPCFVKLLRPSLAQGCVRLLRAVDVEATIPKNQTCCGQPSYNAGHWSQATCCAEKWVRDFADFDSVVAPSASCVAMVHKMAELPGFDGALRSDAEALARRCHEIGDFVSARLGDTDLHLRLQARLAYHDGCHALRGLHLRETPRRLLARVAGLELCELPGRPECCGFGGAFSVKYPELSADMADGRLAAMRQVGCDTLVSTDLSCLAQIEARARRQHVPFTGRHLVEVLVEALPS